MVEKTLSGAGLRGKVAGQTTLSTVGKSGSGLTYRGYAVETLADKALFEEVAYLLLRGELPNQRALDEYKTRLVGFRGLPQSLKAVLECIPPDAHPMDVMRTGCSMLGVLDTETDINNQDDKIDRMLALFPEIINYWYHYSHHGKRIDTNTDEATIAGHFLNLLHGKKPKDLHRQAMNSSLVLYAEHEFNASTFTARVCASTLSDIHSCVTGAIGTLRGKLHGGANEMAMELIEGLSNPDEAEKKLLEKIEAKEKIMGFGHAIYRDCDPRSDVIKDWAKVLAEDVGDTSLYAIAERCEQVMWREKKLFCNADFYHAPAYHFLGIPTKLFTPIFVIARVAGWTSHVKEQRADNRIIRPSADYVGAESRDWVEIQNR